MIVRIMPLAPPIPGEEGYAQTTQVNVPRGINHIRTANSMVRFTGSASGSSSSQPLPRSSSASSSARVLAGIKRTASAEFQLLGKQYHAAKAKEDSNSNNSTSNGRASPSPARKRSRPHSDIGVPVRSAYAYANSSRSSSQSHSQPQPPPQQFQHQPLADITKRERDRESRSHFQSQDQQVQHRHSLKLEHGGNASQLLTDRGFNIRLGQSSRWSLGTGGGGSSKSHSQPSTSSKPSASNSSSANARVRESLLREFGLNPLPPSPKVKQPEPHWAPSRRAPVNSASSSRSGRSSGSGQAAVQKERDLLYFGFKSIKVGPTKIEGADECSSSSSASGSPPSTNSAPAWLDHDHDVDENYDEYEEALLSLSNAGSDFEDSESDDDGLHDISMDSGIDSIETQKLCAAAGSDERRKIAVPKKRSRSHRDIYGVPGDNEDRDEYVLDQETGPEVFAEGFYNYQRKTKERAQQKRVDHFSGLPDEMIMKVLAWLPKPALGRMTQVNKRFNRVVSDESLWTHIDCQGKNLSWEEVDLIVQRQPVYWRMAQANVYVPKPPPVHNSDECADADAGVSTTTLSPLPVSPQLAYLDLSFVIATPAIVNTILGVCTNLRKLSLEHQEITPEILNTARTTFAHSLESLNLTMCYMKGGAAGAEALASFLAASPKLKALNMGCIKQEWSQSEILRVMNSCPNNLLQLNLAGFRHQLTDTHVQVMASRCSKLVELDLSDSQSITMMSIEAVSHLQGVQHLSLSRCYAVEPESYELLCNMKSLRYLELFLVFRDDSVDVLAGMLPGVALNQYPFSAIARPTVGPRRSSIWGERVRDCTD